jgi:predicted Zn-dependent protease
MSRSRIRVLAGIAFLAAALLGPVALARGGGDGKGPPPLEDVDVCVYAAHGSAAEREFHARGGGAGKGGGGQKTCSKTYAKWTKTTLAIYVDSAGTPASIGAANFEAYVVHALAEWACHSGLGESVALTFVGSAASADIVLGWGNLGSTGILGQAATSYFRGVISRSTITMNSNESSFTWTLGPSPSVDGDGCAIEEANGDTSTSNYDLLSVLTHEIGHALGISHPNNKCQSWDHCYPETMYSCTDAEEFMRRALNEGDRAAVGSLYGPDP